MKSSWKKIISSVLLLALGFLCPAASTQTYLSPQTLLASPDGTQIFVTCATTNTVLVFDVATERVTKSIAVVDSPLGLALSPDARQLFVTCAASQSTVCVVELPSGKIARKFRTGHTAMAPICSPDGKTLYVCNRFNNSVAAIDIAKGKELFSVGVTREPVAAALTADGQFLFIANHIHGGPSDVDFVAATVSVIDLAGRKVVKEIPLPNGSTILRDIRISPDGKYAAVTHILARFHLPTTQVERGWMNNNALTLIDVAKQERLNTVLLDNIDSGAGNPWSAAWSSDGKRIVVTHAGTHEISVINATALLNKLAKVPARPKPNQSYEYNSATRSAADVPNDLAFLVDIRDRIKMTDKGPRGLALVGSKVFTANYFSDSLSIIDLSAAEPSAHYAQLGPRIKSSVVRQGELNFNDASLCFQGWQSCASCHSSDARVDGLNWDLLNDGIGNPKNVKSLLFAHKTPPAMWLGVRENAEAGVRAGIRNSLFVVLPDEYAVALDEYLKSLQPTPSPYLVKGKMSAAAKRGKKLFYSDGVGCTECHKPPLFSDLKPHDVGTRGKFDKPTDKFVTPPLVEVWRSAPYLHDGSASTIHDVPTLFNHSDQHGKVSQLSPQQINDLVEFVLSL